MEPLLPTRPPPPRRGSCTGQASAEYAALLTLVAVALAGAGTVPGVADVPRRVVHAMRVGLCVVAGDVCVPADAAAAGLPPCLTGERLTGDGLALTVLSLHLAHRGLLTVARRSDGSVLVTRIEDHALGAMSGIAADVGDVGLTLDASGTYELSLARGRAWLLPSAGAAAGLVAALRRGDEPRPPPTWRFGDLGGELAGALGATAVRSLTAAEASAGGSAGVRVGRGQTTVYVHVHLDGRAPLLDLPRPLGTASDAPHGGGGGPIVVAISRDARGLAEISFRRAEPGPHPGEVVETVGRLDLRDAGNRAAVEPLLGTRLPWPPRVTASLRGVVRRTAQVGTVERLTYALTDRSEHSSASLAAALGLDVQRSSLDVRRRLVEASAWTAGGPERRRVDCLEDMSP